jgi:chlorophyllide a reductase subunit Y
MTTPNAPSTLELIARSGDDNASSAGCHNGAEQRLAADMAGKAEILTQYAKDYPTGPHDQPQSMCPAFGSLRVGLRMRRTATVLSGSACCVYGLTFTSHFYGAKRTVGYVPFDSETLVTGKLFEDIRESAHELADPDRYDAIVIINLCVPTASGVPLDLLPKSINGVRIIGIDVPGFGVPTHAEAKDILAGAMLRYARQEIMDGPVARPRESRGQSPMPSVALLGEIFPVDAITINALLRPMGVNAGPVVPTREWRELYAALDCALVAVLHPHYVASQREFATAGRQAIGSAPVGLDGTLTWLQNVAGALNLSSEIVQPHLDAVRASIELAIQKNPINASMTLSGYEGSELLVARLLTECGADIKYVGTACARTPWSEADRAWLEARGIPVKFRASLEDDLAALECFKPDIAIGTTPVVQRAKELSIPSLYFTNLISARPLMGAAGPAALAEIINTAVGNKERFDQMEAFFQTTGSEESVGIWTKATAEAAGLFSREGSTC